MSRKRQAEIEPEVGRPAGREWLLFLLPVLVLVASLTLSYIWNEDFWWYVTSGRAVIEHGGIPDEDPFLYTSGQGLGWVHNSWLWTVIVAAVEGLGGLSLVLVLHFLVAATIAVLVYTTSRVDRWGLINALAVLLFLVVDRHRLCGKGETVSWLMLAVFYRLLENRGAFGGIKEGFTWRLRRFGRTPGVVGQSARRLSAGDFSGAVLWRR